MGWEGSDRKSRLPPNWGRLRLRVLRRDAYKCQWRDVYTGEKCLAPANQVDHVIPGDDHREENLQSLCAHHHGKKSSQEGNAAKARFPNKRPPERHPGLI